MKAKISRKGIALVLVLLTSLIVFMLGVAVAGLSTQEGRSSLQRSRQIITRQTALAGIKYAQSLLSKDWDNPDIPPPGGKIFDNEYYAENSCYYTVTVETRTPTQCIFNSRAYFREALSGSRELWARGIEATFCRSSFHFALLGLGTPKAVLSYSQTYGYCYTYVYPKSLSIVDAMIDGNIGTAQKYGEITVEPKPFKKKIKFFPGDENGEVGGGGGEGGGGEGEEEEKTQEVELSIESDAVLTMPKIPDFVKVMKQEASIGEPVQYPEPVFPLNQSKTAYNTSITQPPGYYSSLIAESSGQDMTVGGKGVYIIKNCNISSSGGNVQFGDGGTYYIESLTAQGAGTVTLSSGNYYVKSLKLGDSEGGRSLTVKTNIIDKKPVNIIVTDSIDMAGVKLNPPFNEGEDMVSRPGDLIIYGCTNCVTNKLSSVSGSFVFQNKSNVVDVKSCTVDGSLIGNVLNVEGSGKFSCHKEIMSDQAILTRWEEQ
ncbi:MAG: hypothetical protein AB2L14_09590 [Candidatus Xenobiia bacterium LiM19]